ncbi:MAG: hypothetical protein M3Q45_13875 [Chloroflexota bacterium]|nr:hypothetical protein [Chloroflexota bacterium]
MNSTKLNPLSERASTRSIKFGIEKKIKGTIFKVKVTIDDEFRPSIPVLIPELDEVRAAAESLHNRNEYWKGELFGWDVEYNPSLPTPPPTSKMTFTPADFWIGDATIWGFSLMWEDGDDQPPVETLADWNVVEELQSA